MPRKSPDRVTACATALVALGANIEGAWGQPHQTLARAIRELAAAGVAILRCSQFYKTEPMGPGSQPRYLNAVIAIETHRAPAAMLRLVKSLERRAGRRLGRRWGPRALDIDLLDQGGRRIGWPPARARAAGRIILPHPEMHRRAFVLAPLLDVAPSWRHPVLGTSARTLLARLPRSARAGLGQPLASPAPLCEKV